MNQSSSCYAVNLGFIPSSTSENFPPNNFGRATQHDTFPGERAIDIFFSRDSHGVVPGYEDVVPSDPRYHESRHKFKVWTPDATEAARVRPI